MRALRDTTDEIYDQLDARLVHQRHENAIMHVDAWNGAADFLIKQGGLQRDVLGPPDFVHTFAKPVRQWTEAMQDEYEGRLLISCCPITVKHETHEVDLAYSSFADDIARVHVGSSAQEIAEKLFISHHTLKDCLQPYGWNANETKHEAILRVMGKEAQKQKRAITEGEIEVPGKASWLLRYLGPLLHHTLNNSADRTARKEAMRKIFCSMGDFWRSKAPFTYKKAIFISKIAETRISGWTSFCLQNIDYETIHKEIIRYARKILGNQPGNRSKLNKKQNIDQSAMQKFYENLDYARFLQNFGCDELSGFEKW